MIGLQPLGYRSRNLAADLTLGLVYGVSLSLWSYAYAAIVFAGVLSYYLPVGILIMLLGWVLVSVWVVLTSREPLHTASIDDQAVVIFGSIAGLMVAFMGGQAATPRGLSTMLFIMAATTCLFSAGCYAVGRFQLSRILELLPYPVVCGFMASVGWLLFKAGCGVAADIGITSSLLSDLATDQRLLQLGLSIGLSMVLMWLTTRIHKPWVLPVASLAIVAGYYGVVGGLGLSQADQLAQGWLFDVPRAGASGWAMVATVSLGDIDWQFVAQAVPLMLTIILISMLYASMMLVGLKAESQEKLDISQEYRILGSGNLFCVATCCPPGYTEVVAISMYRKYGASSRWFVLSSSAVGLAVAVLGGGIISHVPKLLMSANIFLFAFSMLYDWLYRNVRGFGRLDYGIVLIILANTIFVGFLQGIGMGILLTVLVFVFRYSRISAIRSRHTLADQRSSVERSTAANALLAREGDRVVIYQLRGFLFFGTANAILDTVAEREHLEAGRVETILMEMQRVTGIDVSALNTFAQIKALCDAAGVDLLYSGVPPGTRDKLCAMRAVSVAHGKALVFDEDDFAMEYIEDRLLLNSGFDPGEMTIRDFLASVFTDDRKVELLLRSLERLELAGGTTLFEQGTPARGLYVVEQGALSAYITTAKGKRLRVKKFSPGSLIGELSGYLRDRQRTATVVADRDSVIYHLDAGTSGRSDSEQHALNACIHELVATTLAERVNFMNRRLVVDSGG